MRQNHADSKSGLYTVTIFGFTAFSSLSILTLALVQHFCIAIDIMTDSEHIGLGGYFVLFLYHMYIFGISSFVRYLYSPVWLLGSQVDFSLHDVLSARAINDTRILAFFGRHQTVLPIICYVYSVVRVEKSNTQ